MRNIWYLKLCNFDVGVRSWWIPFGSILFNALNF